MIITVDNEKLINFTSGKDSFQEITDKYFRFQVNLNMYEATDEDVLNLSDELGGYSFLKDDAEDIYSISDGSPLE